MIFDVAAADYAAFMGRYSEPLASRFADVVGVAAGARALDVGCGPGALAAELARRLGAGSVCAVEPSEPFVAEVRARLPGVDVRRAAAERLPFADASFDLTMAQLVVHFMADPVAGLREMARVTRPGGTVAACVWDHGGGRSPMTAFWAAVREFDPGARDASDRPGTRDGDLARLFARAGLAAPQTGELTVRASYATFAEWWAPFTRGVGPAGAYVASLPPGRREALREHCRRALPAGPFEISASAWVARCRD